MPPTETMRQSCSVMCERMNSSWSVSVPRKPTRCDKVVASTAHLGDDIAQPARHAEGFGRLPTARWSERRPQQFAAPPSWRSPSLAAPALCDASSPLLLPARPPAALALTLRRRWLCWRRPRRCRRRRPRQGAFAVACGVRRRRGGGRHRRHQPRPGGGLPAPEARRERPAALAPRGPDVGPPAPGVPPPPRGRARGLGGRRAAVGRRLAGDAARRRGPPGTPSCSSFRRRRHRPLRSRPCDRSFVSVVVSTVVATSERDFPSVGAVWHSFP